MFYTKVVEKIKTHILCSKTLFFDNRAVYEMVWKNFVEPVRPQMTTWRMRIACWIPEATNTNSEYVILASFPLQQWLHEGTSVLRYRLRILSVVLALPCTPYRDIITAVARP